MMQGALCEWGTQETWWGGATTVSSLTQRQEALLHGMGRTPSQTQ